MHEDVVDGHSSAARFRAESLGFRLIPRENVGGQRLLATINVLDGLGQVAYCQDRQHGAENLKTDLVLNTHKRRKNEMSGPLTSSLMNGSSAFTSSITGGMKRSSRSRSPPLNRTVPLDESRSALIRLKIRIRLYASMRLYVYTSDLA